MRDSRYPNGSALICTRDEVTVFLAAAKMASSTTSPAESTSSGQGVVGKMHEPKIRAPVVTWVTCGLDRSDHAISDDDMALGLVMGAGRYAALCGNTVCAASLMSPPGRRCRSCQVIVQRIDRESLPRKTGVLSGLRGRGRPRNDATDPDAVTPRVFRRWHESGGIAPSSTGAMLET